MSRSGLAGVIDFAQVNRSADLLRLCPGELRKVASSQGGEWAGPCPLCGGRDRFHVQPYRQGGGRWLCRKCTGGSWRSPIDLVMALRGVGVVEAARWMGDAEMGGWGDGGTRGRGEGEMGRGGWGAPEEGWQAEALEGLERSIMALWTSEAGEAALRWLCGSGAGGRGLREATLRYFLVGWSAGFRVGQVYLPRGVTLPCYLDETLWYIKIALLPGQEVRCEGCGKTTLARRPCRGCGKLNKYRGVRGNRGEALYNGTELLVGSGGGERRRDALFVEGEFDCMSAWQELRDQVAVVTLGSASGRLDLATWGWLLLRAGRIYTLYDNDAAGERGRQVVRELSRGASVDLRLPEGFKDVGEFSAAGGDLRAWFEEAKGWRQTSEVETRRQTSEVEGQRQTSEVLETSEVEGRKQTSEVLETSEVEGRGEGEWSSS